MTNWPVQKLVVNPPPLSQLIPCITTGLQSNFHHVSVSVVSCPDLTQQPFNLAAAGLCGGEKITDVGSPSYLAPFPDKTKKYSLPNITRLMEMNSKNGFVMGAGAGPFHVLGVNSELMPNLSYSDGEIKNLSRYARIMEDGRVVCERSPSDDCALIGNLFGCDGLTGNVIRMVAKGRTGDLNFTDTIQKAIQTDFPDQPISLGGVFVIRKGKANLHVMPNFSEEPLTTRAAVEEWLRYFDMSAPLVCLSVLHSFDPGMDLRMEHTHCFSDHGEGGHYHDDTTPEEVEYEAYFNVAKALYRIDRPAEVSQFNRPKQ